jgi:hypothetical protein
MPHVARLESHVVAHLPFEHTVPDGHFVPQSPQLLGSVFGLAQTCPQRFVPPPHVSAHAPCEQTCPSLQAAPHFPQLSRSRLRSAQVPLQSVKVPQPTIGVVPSSVDASG